MDNLQNLDIFDFLASLGKHAISKATQGFSNSRPKQSKRSDIVFVEDTDEYANLSNECGFTDRENKRTCFGGEWKTKDNSYESRTKKNDTSHKWKGNTQPKDNCGWGEKKKVTQNSGWETGTWNESDSGWGEQDGRGWDKGTQAKCDDGWGEEKKDSSWGCGDREAAFDTGWGKEEEYCEGTQSTEKAGTHVGQQSSVQQEDKGWRCSLQKEEKSWGSSLLKEDDGDGGGEEKEPTLSVGAKRKGVFQQEGIQKGWRNSTRQQNNGGWGEGKSDPDKRGRGAQGEGTQSGWGRSIQEVSDGGWGEAKGAGGGWGEDKSTAGGRDRGAQEEATENGWGSSIHQENDSGWGEDTSDAGGWRKKEEVSAPGRWEKGAREEDRQNRWGGSVLQETNGGWREEKGASSGGQKRGSQNEWESSTLKKNSGGGCGEDKCAPVGWERATLEEGTQDGWGSSVHPKNEKKGVSGGWGEHAQTNSTQMQPQGSMPSKSNSGWAREGNVSTDGWREKGKAASGRWGEGTPKEGDGWGAEKKLATVQWGGKKKFDPARWTDTTKERASSGWRGNAQDAGWDERTAGGWGQSVQQEVDDGWGSSIEKSDASRWGEGKDSTCSGWGERKGVADGRDKDAQKENDDGWGEKQGVASGGGCKAGARKEGGEGWGSGIEKKSDSGWGDQKRAYAGGSRAFEETNEWGKAKEGVLAGWEQTTHDEVDDGWRQNIQPEVDSGWGQAKDGSSGGWKEERGGTTCGWGEDNGAWGEGTSDTSLGRENKATTSRLEKGTQKEHGWVSSTQEDSNAGWGEATAGWEQSSHHGGEDGWGEFTRENNTSSDTSGRNRTSKSAAASWNKAVNGWEPSTQVDDTRRSGTFGPSGSNTVPLGKRKGMRPMRDNGATGEVNDQEPHQDGRQRWGKRFNNGNAWRDSASICPQNQNRRPRLRALISLPEYSEMDGLYKATNRILHHSGYQPGDRLNPDDERFVLEEVLAHHREKESKLGCGVEYMMIDSHADHQVSCFWVVRTDGSKIDFSYWKCLEHLFEVKYPHAVREVHREGGNDGGVVAPVESVEAKEKDSREEGVAPLGRVEAEEKVTTQEENDGW